MDDYNDQSGHAEAARIADGGAIAAKEKLSEGASSVKEKVADLSRTAAHKMEQARESVAGVLDQTALSMLSGSDRISAAANSVADNLGATAAYVRRSDLKAVGEDILDLMKRYPWQTVAAGAILGFMVGRVMPGHD